MHTTEQQDNQTTTQLNNKTTQQQDNTERSESNPGRNLGGNDGTEGAVWKTVPCIESVLVLSVLAFRQIQSRSSLVFKLLGRFLVHWLYGVKTRQNKSYAFTSQKLCFYLLITMLLPRNNYAFTKPPFFVTSKGEEILRSSPCEQGGKCVFFMKK